MAEVGELAPSLEEILPSEAPLWRRYISAIGHIASSAFVIVASGQASEIFRESTKAFRSD